MYRAIIAAIAAAGTILAHSDPDFCGAHRKCSVCAPQTHAQTTAHKPFPDKFGSEHRNVFQLVPKELAFGILMMSLPALFISLILPIVYGCL